MTTAAPDLPAAPPGAAAVFGDRLPVLVAYAELLATAGVERGLLGPRETPRLWERHVLNCAGLSELVQDGQTVLDLGSGAGLPGLVLAAARPGVTVVLCEPLLRRAAFLSEAVGHLGLTSVVVRRARAEELAGKVVVDAVTARAVAPLEKLAGWALPLVGPGGRLLALKGEQAQAELDQAGPALRRLGAARSEVVPVGTADHGTEARVVVVERGEGASSAKAPRKGAEQQAAHRGRVQRGRR